MLEPLDETVECQSLHGLVRVRGGQSAQSGQVAGRQLQAAAERSDGLRVLLVLDLGGAQVLPGEHVRRLLQHGHLEQEHGVDDVVRLEPLQALLERRDVRLEWILRVELVGFVGVKHLLEVIRPGMIWVGAAFF